MIFNKHSTLKDAHAFLSASKYHWINYDDEKLMNSFYKHQATIRGTKMHELAKDMIELGVKLPKTKNSFNCYVNDAIGYKMNCEQVLYFSENCFGTTDAISFRKNFLRIHDLKTGETKGSMNQLLIYTSLFCLEYKIKPIDIETELRIYQSDDISIISPTPEDIINIMNKIIRFDKKINDMKGD